MIYGVLLAVLAATALLAAAPRRAERPVPIRIRVRDRR